MTNAKYGVSVVPAHGKIFTEITHTDTQGIQETIKCQVIDTRDTPIMDALCALGWTSPENTEILETAANVSIFNYYHGSDIENSLQEYTGNALINKLKELINT